MASSTGRNKEAAMVAACVAAATASETLIGSAPTRLGGRLEPQDEWCCPITLEIMKEPHLLAGDGNSYEKASIEAWIAQEQAAEKPLTSPKSGADLGVNGEMTFPNMALRAMIRTWVVKHHQEEYVPWWETRLQ